jgi:hypothetical protein
VNTIASKITVIEKTQDKIVLAKSEPKNEKAVALLKKLVSPDPKSGHSKNTADFVSQGEESIVSSNPDTKDGGR